MWPKPANLGGKLQTGSGVLTTTSAVLGQTERLGRRPTDPPPPAESEHGNIKEGKAPKTNKELESKRQQKKQISPARPSKCLICVLSKDAAGQRSDLDPSGWFWKDLSRTLVLQRHKLQRNLATRSPELWPKCLVPPKVHFLSHGYCLRPRPPPEGPPPGEPPERPPVAGVGGTCLSSRRFHGN